MAIPAIVWSPAYEVDIGPHVFPTRKYRLVRERLLAGGRWRESDFLEAEPASAEMLRRVHTAEYLRKIREDDFRAAERMALEVPFSPALRRAAILCCGGTAMACRLAMRDRVAVHLGGGFHHAFADHGEGFCLLNDVAIAAADALASGAAERVLVVDLDVHHGNGTAAIFAGDPRVYTMSMHQERNYPAVKPPSDLDVGLADGTADASYLEALRVHLGRALEAQRPDLVLYLAGADPYREDQLGGLGLSLEGLRRRDGSVLVGALSAGAAVAVVLAGGYAFRVADTVAIHVATVEAARAAVDPVPGR